MGKRMLIAVFLLVPALAFGQAAATKKLAWDQAASNLAEAQAYAYKYYADGSASGVALSGVTCSGAASPFVCEVAFPAFTPGPHTIAVTASNVAGESVASPVFSFTFSVVPTPPANVRIK